MCILQHDDQSFLPRCRTQTVRHARRHMQRAVPANTMFDAVDFGHDLTRRDKYELFIRMTMYCAPPACSRTQARHVQGLAADQIARPDTCGHTGGDLGAGNASGFFGKPCEIVNVARLFTSRISTAGRR